MKPKNPEVSIIIANYNGEKYLRTCLNSVLSNTFRDYEIIICDDGSTDKSVKIINSYMRNDKKIKLTLNNGNMGAAASRNKAFTLARGRYLVFLDNDTEVDKNWLRELVNTTKKYPRAGAVQSKLRDFQNRNLIQTAGVKLWAATGWGLVRGQGEVDKGQWDREDEIAASSAALLVKKEVYGLIGGFDVDEAVSTEDLDLSWRIWLTGHQILLSPKSITYHWNKPIGLRKNLRQTYEKTYFHLTKNSLLSIVKNYELANSIKYFFYSIFISFGRAVLVLWRRQDASALKGTLRGLFWVLGHIYLIFKKRSKIQSIRKFSDGVLFQKVIVKSSLISVYKEYYKQTGLL